MPVIAILLLVASAFLHTAWNILLKQTGEKYVATWWAIFSGSIAFLPALLFVGFPTGDTWPLLLGSVVVEALYYIVLSAAYNDSDFSLVYPIARGTAPALIASWSILFLGERLTSAGLAGLGVIVTGLLVIGLTGVIADRTSAPTFIQANRPPSSRGIFLALVLALLISVYSSIDGAAVKRTAALPYAVLIFLLTPVFTAPLVVRRFGWQLLRREWTGHRWRIIAIGILTVFAYLLALEAYTIAPISYSGAIREVSVVIGAFAGWHFLGEKMGGLRVFGAVVIFTGIFMIALYG
jgi:drug/metabolite transporter (DMT)-like permease